MTGAPTPESSLVACVSHIPLSFLVAFIMADTIAVGSLLVKYTGTSSTEAALAKVRAQVPGLLVEPLLIEFRRVRIPATFPELIQDVKAKTQPQQPAVFAGLCDSHGAFIDGIGDVMRGDKLLAVYYLPWAAGAAATGAPAAAAAAAGTAGTAGTAAAAGTAGAPPPTPPPSSLPAFLADFDSAIERVRQCAAFSRRHRLFRSPSRRRARTELALGSLTFISTVVKNRASCWLPLLLSPPANAFSSCSTQ
jgi:hypothetical protein